MGFTFFIINMTGRCLIIKADGCNHDMLILINNMAHAATGSYQIDPQHNEIITS